MSEPWSSRDFFSRLALDNTSPFRRTYAQAYQASTWSTHRAAMRTTWVLISLNVAVFGAWTYAQTNKDAKLTRWLRQNFMLSLNNWREGRTWTLLTSAFSHQAVYHILFNMLTLHTFATMLSWVPGIGGVHMLALSLGSGLAGSYAWLYQQQQSSSSTTKDRGWSNIFTQAPTRIEQGALGASAMVMGVGAAAACLMPRAPVRLMGILKLPLWLATLGFAAVDAYFLHSETSPVAHGAHLGGAAFGVSYFAVFLMKFGGLGRFLGRRR